MKLPRKSANVILSIFNSISVILITKVAKTEPIFLFLQRFSAYAKTMCSRNPRTLGVQVSSSIEVKSIVLVEVIFFGVKTRKSRKEVDFGFRELFPAGRLDHMILAGHPISSEDIIQIPNYCCNSELLYSSFELQ